MNANEMVIVSRIALHYEDQHGMDPDLAEVSAERDFTKFKKEAKKLWRLLYDDRDLSDREIGDEIYNVIFRWSSSGMSFKNYAAEELRRRTRP